MPTKKPTPKVHLPDRDDGGSVVLERLTQRTKPPQMFQVLMLNDDFTPMEFVVMVLQEFFSKDREAATQIMLQIHLDGKGVVPVAEMQGKLKAALDARHSSNTLILARTDALAVEGIDAALERAEAYLACGVDALFVEALRSPEQMDRACAQFAKRIPLLANMVEGGQTPIQSATELGDRGFKIVIFPGGTARAVAHTLQGYYGSLHAHQTTTPWRDQMLNFDELNQVIGTPELLANGKQYDVKP